MGPPRSYPTVATMSHLLGTSAWALDAGVLAATFIVIFPAELPDKSFIATLILGAR